MAKHYPIIEKVEHFPHDEPPTCVCGEPAQFRTHIQYNERDVAGVYDVCREHKDDMEYLLENDDDELEEQNFG